MADIEDSEASTAAPMLKAPGSEAGAEEDRPQNGPLPEDRVLNLRQQARPWRPQSAPRSITDAEMIRSLKDRLGTNTIVIVSSLDEDPLRALVGAAIGGLGLDVLELSEDRVAAPWRLPSEGDALTPAVAGSPAKSQGRSLDVLRIDDLAGAIPIEQQPSLLVVWAHTPRTLAFIDSLRSTSGGLTATEERLRARRLGVLVLTHDALLLDPEERERTELLRSKRRELDHLSKSLSSTDASATPDAVVLSELFARMFSPDELRDFLRTIPGSDSHHELPRGGTPMEAYLNAADFLLHRGLDDDELLRMLRERRPKRRVEINHAWTRLTRSREALLGRRRQLQVELDVLKAAAPAVTAPFPVIFIDAVEAFLRAQALAPSLRDRFDSQRADGHWGLLTEDVVRNLRACVLARTLESEIALRGLPERDTEPPSMERFKSPPEAGPEVAAIVLFVACFIPALDPDDFDRVVAELLRYEQAERPPAPADPKEGPERTGEGGAALAAPQERRPAAPPLPLDQRWRRDADVILGWCSLVIGQVEEDGRRSLRVGWRVARHGEEWKGLLRRSRHYFVARQIEHIKRSALLFMPEVDGERLFERLLLMLLEHAEISLSRHAGAWLHWFRELLDHLHDQAPDLDQVPEGGPALASFIRLLQTFEALERLERTEFIANRLSIVMRHMLRKAPLRGVVEGFLRDLIGGDQRSRTWARILVGNLAGAEAFDEMKWLGLLYVHGMTDVSRSLVEHCFQWRDGTWLKASRAVDQWLASEESAEEGTTKQLALQTAASAITLATYTWGPLLKRQTPLFHWLLGAGEAADAPAMLRWLFNPAVGSWIEAHLADHIPAMVARVWFPAEPTRRGPDPLRLRAAEIFDRELDVRFDPELRVRRRGQPGSHTLFIATALTLITFRLASPDPETAAPPPVPQIAERMVGAIYLIAERLVLLRVTGILGAFEVCLEEFTADPDLSAEESFTAHCTRMSAAARELRTFIEKALTSKKEPAHA